MTETQRAKFNPRAAAPPRGAWAHPPPAGPCPGAHCLAPWGRATSWSVLPGLSCLASPGPECYGGGDPAGLSPDETCLPIPVSLGVSDFVPPPPPLILLCVLMALSPHGPMCPCVSPVCVSPWPWVGLSEVAITLPPPAAPGLPHSVISASVAGDGHSHTLHGVPWADRGRPCQEPAAHPAHRLASACLTPSHGSHVPAETGWQ